MEAEFEGGLVGKFPNRDEFYLGYAFYLGFVEELGVGPGQVEYYAGLAVSVNALAAALMAPIWGVWRTVTVASP